MKSETALERMLMVWRTPSGMFECTDGVYLMTRIDDDVQPFLIEVRNGCLVEQSKCSRDETPLYMYDSQCRFLGPIPKVT